MKDLSKVFGEGKPVQDYVRYLDIENAVAGVNFRSDATSYTRRYFISAPNNVVVARYTAEGADKLHLLFSVTPTMPSVPAPWPTRTAAAVSPARALR